MAIALQQLTYFVAVAERGNLTRAAADLHLAQPSLSTQIRRLERELHTPLFERVARGVVLTRAGAALLPIARQALADVDQLRRSANELTSPDGGVLRVGATPSLSAALLPTALAAFHDSHPRVTLEFTEASSGEIVGLLERDELDLALVNLPIAQRTVETIPLGEEDMVVAVAGTHALHGRRRIRIEELADVPLVIPREGYRIRTTALSACRRAGFEPLVACGGGELSGVLGLVAQGLGAAIVPAAATAHLPGVHAIRIDRPSLVRTIALARRAHAIGPPSAEAFVRHVLLVVRDAGRLGIRPTEALLADPTGTPAWPAPRR